MKNLLYASRQVFKWKASNFVKLFSLVLGFSLSALMLTRYAYDLTYDGFYPDSKRIYLVYTDYTIGPQSRDKFSVAFAPLAPALEEEVSGLQAVTRFWSPNDQTFVHNNKEYSVKLLQGDPHFFEVFGYEFVKGDASLFNQPGTLFLSETKAGELFDDEDPLDAIITNLDGRPYTVRAVFKDIPQNSSWEVDAVAYLAPSVFSTQWNTQNWATTAVKLSNGVSPKSVDPQIEALQQRHYDVEAAKSQNQTFRLYLHPLDTHHQVQGSAAEANMIIILLGILILTISSLNYVLLSLSSLSSRAKEIGVHKCNGASQGSVFALIFWESFIYCVLAIILSILMLVVFRGQLETITNGSLSGIFSFKNLYATLLTAMLLLGVSAVIPARVFSTIPVTQVFHQQTQRRTPWKKALLFVQLFATVFISAFLWMTIRQNNVLFDKGPGYNIQQVASLRFKPGDLNHAGTVQRELERLHPLVENVSIASSIPLDYPSGTNVYEPGSDNVLLSARIIYTDNHFLDVYQIPLLAGNTMNNPLDTLNAVVNELFIKYAQWDMSQGYEGILGRQVHFQSEGRERTFTITGVCKDFQLGNMKIAPAPLLLTGYPAFDSDNYIKMAVALSTMDNNTLSMLSEQVEHVVPNTPIQASSYEQLYFDQEQSIKSNKIVMIMAAITIGIITLIGVVSYVSAELARRRKEIAIRRLSGGTTYEILAIVSQGLLGYALAAAITGGMLARYICGIWLRDFTLRTSLPAWMFIAVGVALLLVIALICCLQSLHVLRGNPINNLKSE